MTINISRGITMRTTLLIVCFLFLVAVANIRISVGKAIYENEIQNIGARFNVTDEQLLSDSFTPHNRRRPELPSIPPDENPTIKNVDAK